MVAKLRNTLETSGYSLRIVPFQRLHNLKATIEEQYQQGLFEEDFYHEHIRRFTMWSENDFHEARSLIVVSHFSPQVRYTFNRAGKQYPLIAPPTYVHWQKADSQVENAFTDIIASKGYWVKKATVPVKSLAVASGLAEYGRNNISYVEGMGSYHYMKAYYSNLPSENDAWRAAKMMECCESCQLCTNACPTGAIDPNRFTVRAERCITHWNEKPGDIPFPDGIDASWTRCMAGCMHCQHICPANSQMNDIYEQGGEFTEEETGILLKGLPQKDLPAALSEKLKKLEILWMYEYLPRNLNAIIT